MECSTIKHQHEQDMGVTVTEIRMLQWMCNHIRYDRIRDKIIPHIIGVAPIQIRCIKNN